MQKIIFITGTDTGVGKTVLTALLLTHLRQAGFPAFALKPFCSGGRADAELLHSLQNGDLTLDQINPFHFIEPLAPLVAAQLHQRKITLQQTLRHIQQISARHKNPSIHRSKNPKIQPRTPPLHPSITPVLLIEGAGGLLAPLGYLNSQFKVQRSRLKVQSSKYYTALDLITTLHCRVIVVAPNRLGTINHTLLTVQALPSAALKELKVVLVDILPPRHSTLDTHSNPSLLTQFLAPIPLYTLPHLGPRLAYPGRIERLAKKLEQTLAPILEPLSN